MSLEDLDCFGCGSQCNSWKIEINMLKLWHSQLHPSCSVVYQLQNLPCTQYLTNSNVQNCSWLSRSTCLWILWCEWITANIFLDAKSWQWRHRTLRWAMMQVFLWGMAPPAWARTVACYIGKMCTHIALAETPSAHHLLAPQSKGHISSLSSLPTLQWWPVVLQSELHHQVSSDKSEWMTPFICSEPSVHL